MKASFFYDVASTLATVATAIGIGAAGHDLHARLSGQEKNSAPLQHVRRALNRPNADLKIYHI